MSDENGFGVALRAARVAAGLSQSELGEPEFSRSYISLVESGHRAPSREIVEHVAGRPHPTCATSPSRPTAWTSGGPPR